MDDFRPPGSRRPTESGSFRSKTRLVRSGLLYLAVALGLLCLIGTWGASGTITCAVLIALMVAVIASASWPEGGGRKPMRRITRLSVSSALAGPAAIGLIAVFSFTGVLIVLIFVLTTPALTSLVRSRWFGVDDRPAGHGARAARDHDHASSGRGVKDSIPAPMPELSALDVEALCLAWRRSFLVLEAARSAAERLAVVDQRQKYLDELHRRSPDGLAAWLAAGARASGNPLPYVVRPWRAT
jgi:hypothetical protein